jgi:hypothetical protein
MFRVLQWLEHFDCKTVGIQPTQWQNNKRLTDPPDSFQDKILLWCQPQKSNKRFHSERNHFSVWNSIIFLWHLLLRSSSYQKHKILFWPKDGAKGLSCSKDKTTLKLKYDSYSHNLIITWQPSTLCCLLGQSRISDFFNRKLKSNW